MSSSPVSSTPHKCFVFDMDGTLLDSLADLALACNTMLERHNLPVHPVQSYRVFVGNGFKKLIERALGGNPAPGSPKFEALMQEAKTFYSEHMCVHTKPDEGIVSMLHALGEQGTVLAILSNKPDPLTSSLAEDFFPSTFALVRGQRPNVPLKPNPEAVLAMIDELGFAKGDVAYVGDTATDMQTARNAGLFAIGVTWGFRDKKELEDNGADVVVHHPSELVGL
ncbi:MAG: HAD family hydrolase [Candidatus Desulfovibrio faecigallinarum]|nr:HAD family hydrolase [Candidatus Desulfovibrio faecigallinarum]